MEENNNSKKYPMIVGLVILVIAVIVVVTQTDLLGGGDESPTASNEISVPELNSNTIEELLYDVREAFTGSGLAQSDVTEDDVKKALDDNDVTDTRRREQGGDTGVALYIIDLTQNMILYDAQDAGKIGKSLEDVGIADEADTALLLEDIDSETQGTDDPRQVLYSTVDGGETVTYVLRYGDLVVGAVYYAVEMPEEESADDQTETSEDESTGGEGTSDEDTDSTDESTTEDDSADEEAEPTGS